MKGLVTSMSLFFFRLRRACSRPALFGLGVLALLLSLGGVPTGASAHANRPSSGGASFGSLNLVVQATSATISGSHLYINNAQTNGQRQAILLVTQNWNPNGQGGTYNNHPVGVWYDASVGEWTIFNEDGAAMPPGASFNVVGPTGPAPTIANGLFYTHIAANATGDYSDLADSLSTNNPNAIVFVTETSTVDGATIGCTCPHSLGVWYNTSTGHWSIFNEDVTAMNPAEDFNVLVFPNTVSVGASTPVTVVSVSATVAGDYTNLPFDGGVPPTQAYIITPNWNPPGQCCVYHNHNVGVWYNASVREWAIFNEDLAAMPVGVSFNLLPAFSL
jgi:hypothetical protein